jgi:6-phosphofructokinase 1
MRIGVLTGGGDCGGLNAAIRAVVLRAARAGHSALGVYDGWAGMVEGRGAPLSVKDVAAIVGLGGTILGSSRTNPAKIANGYERVEANFQALGIDALVAIGGDDTLGVAAKLAERGGKVVGVPKTMDNDVNGTDSCIGFQTAVERVTTACDDLRTTADSHHRILVLEVMGRHAGWVAIEGGMAGGADAILIPEAPSQLAEVAAQLKHRHEEGYASSIVVVAEGAEIEGLETGAEQTGTVDAFGHAQLVARALGERLADRLGALTGIESRAMVLGHLQRGGPPTAFDRVLGARLGAAAVDLVLAGEYGKAPVLRGMRIVPVDLAETVALNRTADLDLYQVAQSLTVPV